MAHTFSNPCTVADLWFVAPIFGVDGCSSTDADRVETFLQLAEETTDREVFGDKAPWAVCFMAAHLLFEDAAANSATPGQLTPTGAGYAGAITGESVGPITRSFGAATGGAFVAGGAAAYDREALATTPWGKKLVQLRSSLMVRGIF